MAIVVRGLRTSWMFLCFCYYYCERHYVHNISLFQHKLVFDGCYNYCCLDFVLLVNPKNIKHTKLYNYLHKKVQT